MNSDDVDIINKNINSFLDEYIIKTDNIEDRIKTKDLLYQYKSVSDYYVDLTMKQKKMIKYNSKI